MWPINGHILAFSLAALISLHRHVKIASSSVTEMVDPCLHNSLWRFFTAPIYTIYRLSDWPSVAETTVAAPATWNTQHWLQFVAASAAFGVGVGAARATEGFKRPVATETDSTSTGERQRYYRPVC